MSSARARPSYVRQPQQAKEQNGQVEQPPQEPKKSVIPTGKMPFFYLLYLSFFIYIFSAWILSLSKRKNLSLSLCVKKHTPKISKINVI